MIGTQLASVFFGLGAGPNLLILIALFPLVVVLTWMTVDLLRIRRKRRDWNRATAEALAVANERHPSRHPSVYDQRCTNPNCGLCRRVHGEWPGDLS